MTVTSALAEPAYLAGDSFHYDRVTQDLAANTSRTSTITWEALESTETGHRMRITETAVDGSMTETIWRLDRDHNVLAQEMANGCDLTNEPNSGRYRWPMSTDSQWSAPFRSNERCPGTAEAKLVAECEVLAKVVAQGEFGGLDQPYPAIAIERVVLCRQPAYPGYVLVRWEKELLCPTLGVRCTLEADTVILAPNEATEAALAAYRSRPEDQRFTGRASDTIVGFDLM